MEKILRLKAYKLRYTALTATHFDFNDPKVYFIQNACEPCLTRFYAFKSRARSPFQYDTILRPLCVKGAPQSGGGLLKTCHSEICLL